MTVEEEEDKPPANSMAWLVTFTDLVSLMLTFFVMLFAMSNVKTDSWDDMVDALSQTLNPSQQRQIAAATAEFNIATIFRRRAIDLDYLAAILTESIEKDPALYGTQIVRQDERLVIALPGDLLFSPGSAVLGEKSRQALFDMGGLLRNVGNTVGINGHTDPVAPSGQTYASNWELSMARAVAVANTLKRSGYTEKIVSFGYADSRYKQLPKIEDLSDEERHRMARRVDIVILPTTGGNE